LAKDPPDGLEQCKAGLGLEALGATPLPLELARLRQTLQETSGGELAKSYLSIGSAMTQSLVSQDRQL